MSLHDVELFDEVVLTAQLIEAANDSDRRLSQQRIEVALGTSAQLQ